MSHRLTAKYIAVQHSVTERVTTLRQHPERGAGLVEYLLILGGVVILFGIVYAAYQAFVARKVGILNGA